MVNVESHASRGNIWRKVPVDCTFLSCLYMLLLSELCNF